VRGAARRFSRRISPKFGARLTYSRGGYRRHAGHAPQIFEAAIVDIRAPHRFSMCISPTRRARPADSRGGYRRQCGVHPADFRGGHRRHAGRTSHILDADITDIWGAPRRFSRRLSQPMRGAPRKFSRRLSPTCWARPVDSRGGYRRHAGRAQRICEAGIADTEGAVLKVARVSFSSNMRLADSRVFNSQLPRGVQLTKSRGAGKATRY
jgi:hypothetical protein